MNNEPLSLPENRTEEENRALMHFLDATTKTETREVEPGVYEHTFTPLYKPTDVLSRVLDDIYANARTNSHMLLISAEDARRIRHFYHLGRMYRAYPIPRRKIRKCHMRKLHAAWRKGRAHIRRVEQAEWVREEAEMQRIAEEQSK